MGRAKVNRVLVLVSLLGAVVAACTGGGGSGGASPASRCQDFLSLTSDCYASAGQPLPINTAACGDTSALDSRTLAEIDCALASRDAYCRTITAAASRDASAAVSLAADPEIVKLNACIASEITVSPCKDAIVVLGNCGVAYGFAPDCPAQNAAVAKCIVDNPTGACAAYRPREAGTTYPPEATAFQQCQIDASRAALDAGR
jgi:hypothetical protein